MPPAEPLWTPSFITFTLKFPITAPLNEVVIHKVEKSKQPESRQNTTAGSPSLDFSFSRYRGKSLDPLSSSPSINIAILGWFRF